MNEQGFERRLQRCFDERRDPLDDDVLVEFAAAEPMRIERLVNLRARVQQLPAVVARVSPPRLVAARRSWRWWTVAATLTAAAGVLGALLLRDVAVPAPVPVPARRGAIVSAELYEIRPLARSTAQFTVREVLASGAGVHFETFDQRSEVR